MNSYTGEPFLTKSVREKCGGKAVRELATSFDDAGKGPRAAE